MHVEKNDLLATHVEKIKSKAYVAKLYNLVEMIAKKMYD